ncbi:hypothetical protein [Deinococcus sp. LM3]|uniref:hypothetical protein n=1 Tax=Deinococcus sp. LM3 TaxID=1938608 RepID=UPI0009C9479B|nr:hypothetical protein [Deinococcus sp. LM3]OOV11336.1 hypothetical protein BXU09_19920 [Deinococcus sp. LM3]
MVWSRVALSFWFVLLLAAIVINGLVPDARLLGAVLMALLTCLLMGGVTVALWRWDQRVAAYGAAGLTVLQGAVLVRQFAQALNG